MADLNATRDIKGNFDLNSAVIRSVPPGLTVVRADNCGPSAWSKTAKITTEDENGNPVLFFLKLVDGDAGRPQFEGEFMGMTELYKLMPNLIPKPYAWGEFQGGLVPTSFLLIEFKHFTDGMPDPAKLGKRLAELHSKSMSATGMFGFPLTTYDGARTQTVDWDPCWTSFFTKLLHKAYEHDIATNGHWEDFDQVFDRACAKLIPRLIGALESEGRSVKPVLIHGNLWDGNVGTDIENGDPWIYDAAAYYGHNEMDLGIWRAERHQLRANIYRKSYLRHIERSEPVDEWDDRNRLYSVKTNLMCSACVPGHSSRRLAYNDLSYLINKYVPWAEDTPLLEPNSCRPSASLGNQTNTMPGPRSATTIIPPNMHQIQQLHDTLLSHEQRDTVDQSNEFQCEHSVRNTEIPEPAIPLPESIKVRFGSGS